MGLINEGDEYVTLTDILGAEDAFGDMDFKVAGTKDFVTALQLDTKLDGIPSQVLAGALSQAKDARTTILEVMAEAIDSPDEMSPYAPRVTAIKVPVDKIGEVIGPKGKMINSIQDDTGAEITIEDDGTIYVGATDGPSAEAARQAINSIANPHMPEVGERYLGTVVKTTTFGAFVELAKGTDGLLHISNVSPGQRVDAVEDVLNKGDEIAVRVVEVDRERGRIGLRLAEDPEIAGKSAEELAGVGSGGGGGPRRERSDRGDRGDRNGGRGSGRPRHRSGGGRDPERG
jgi:polyribonucleotide nucleotidyltransferase